MRNSAISISIVYALTLYYWSFAPITLGDDDPDDQPIRQYICAKDLPPAIGTINPAIIPKVYDGRPAFRGKFPYYARLQTKSLSVRYLCGATVISPEWILTAAHCRYYDDRILIPTYEFVLTAGSISRAEDPNNVDEQKASIASIVTHPLYNNRSYDYDFALMRLSTPLRFSDTVSPICLPADCSSGARAGDECQIMGFGVSSPLKSVYSENLLFGNIPIVEQEECDVTMRRRTAQRANITEQMFCAGSLNSMTDSCKGDGGGPLACNVKDVFGNQKPVLNGIASWGIGCGGNLTGAYSVYARVCQVIPWILNLTGISTVPAVTTTTSTTSTTSTTTPKTTTKTTTIAPSSCGKNNLYQPLSPDPTVAQNQFPWSLRLVIAIDRDDNENAPVCGGTLIDNQWIITSARCLAPVSYDPSKVTAQFGASSSFSANISGAKIEIPDGYFGDDSNSSDIALLKLTHPVPLSADNLTKICLDCKSATMACKPYIIAGWGTLDSSGRWADHSGSLKKVQFSNVSLPQACKLSSNETILCVANTTQSGNPCQGDRGGGLYCLTSKRHFLVGVTSIASEDCSKGKAYVIYTKVCSHIDWINNVMKEDIAEP